MTIVPRKLLLETTGDYPTSTSTSTSSSCTFFCISCSDGNRTCIRNCAAPSFSPLSPPPPPGHASPEAHIMPYLIAMVCVLGIAFLLISTCTILLRNRWATRRRNTIRVMATAASLREDFLDDDRRGGAIDYPIWHIVTVGLSQSAIDSITSFKYNRRDGLIEGNDCSVCLTEFEDGDELRLLPKCSHAFHVSCIDTWLRCHKNCPLCRAPIVTEAPAPTLPPAYATVPVGNISGSPNSVEATTQVQDLGNGDAGLQPRQGQNSEQPIRDRADAEIGSVPVDGAAIAEILKKNRELRAVLSDLGESSRGFGEDVQVLRRSVSLDPSVAVALAAGSSVARSDEETNAERDGDKPSGDEDTSGRLRGSPSDGCSLQKSPVAVKRSVSSSNLKFFSSFRRSKNQVSSLPL